MTILLYHGMRREELCKLKVIAPQSREGVSHFKIHGKGGKIRFIPVNPVAQRLVSEYLADSGHGNEGGWSACQPR